MDRIGYKGYREHITHFKIIAINLKMVINQLKSTQALKFFDYRKIETGKLSLYSLDFTLRVCKFRMEMRYGSVRIKINFL